MPRKRINWSDYPGPYLQFAAVSTDDGKYIIQQSVMGDDAFFATIRPFEGPGVGELFNFCWIEGGQGQGANTQPEATPPLFNRSGYPTTYVPSPQVASVIASWNDWANNVWLG